MRFYFIFLCTVYVSYQSLSNRKTKACILWTDSASFTWFGALKLCNQWNACFCSTSCFKRRLPHLLEMYSPGCCTGISFIPNTYLMPISELLGLPKDREALISLQDTALKLSNVCITHKANKILIFVIWFYFGYCFLFHP